VITLEPIITRNVAAFKEVRLRALEDSPSAFGSTYAREVQLTDADWAERAARWNGEKGIGFLAMDASVACGLAGSFLDEADSGKAQLISMWTAPTHRQRGVGRLLVEEIAAWARRRGATALQLMVTSSNQPAMLFYERLGFTRTGRTEPYPNDGRLIEYEMSRTLL
jgi:ribosomal protein S18 acetylase RimI-like enzyme